MAITIPLLLMCVASQPPPRMAMMLTTPNGMLKRIVLNLLKPKDWTIKGPNVPIPPDGILQLISSARKTQGGRMDLRDGRHKEEPAP